MKKQWCAAMSIISAAVLTAGIFPETAVPEYLSGVQQVSAAAVQEDQMVNFDPLLGQVYEYDDGTMDYQLTFNGSAGNIFASMGTFSSGGSGTGGISFEIPLSNGISKYENIDIYVSGYGVVESDNSVILIPGQEKVSVDWINADGQKVVNADFILLNGDDVGSAETEETSVPQNQTEPVEIVASVKNLSYMGNRIYPLTAGRGVDNNLGVSSVGQTGILYAAALDMDEDGNKEILAVTYEASSQIKGENTIHLSILKQSDGNWNVLTETEVLGTKYGLSLIHI